MINKIVLASKSGVRKKILDKSGISCEVIAANVDEELIKEALLKEKATPELISKNLAELKANKVSEKKHDYLVLGADSVIDLMSIFKVMERRLFIYIMNPAMIVSWIFGALLIHTIGMDNFSSLWLQLKLVFVIILTIYHFFLFQCLRKFVENDNPFSSKFYRIINEMPAVLLIVIILVVVFKPL